MKRIVYNVGHICGEMCNNYSIPSLIYLILCHRKILFHLKFISLIFSGYYKFKSFYRLTLTLILLKYKFVSHIYIKSNLYVELINLIILIIPI